MTRSIWPTRHWAAPVGLTTATVVRLIRMTAFVRVLTVGVVVVSLLFDTSPLPLPAALLLVGLTVTSYLGLSSPSVRRIVVAHPSLALLDVLLVVAAMVFVGQAALVGLLAVSSALLIGVMLRAHVALPLLAVLLAGHVASLSRGTAAPGGPSVDAVVVMPAVYTCLVVVGIAFRRLAAAEATSSAAATAGAATAAAAAERLRLAREMHDSVARSVHGMSLQANALRQWVARDPVEASRQAGVLALTARETTGLMRDLLVVMRADDPRRSFETSLREWIDEWSTSTGHEVRLTIRIPADPSTAVRYEVSAALAEALENIRRHAVSAVVTVTVHGDAESLRVCVSDDGPGFSAAHASRARAAGHFGVSGMHERLTGLGGWCDVHSEPGLGTRVELSAPLREGSPHLAVGAA